MTLALCRGGHEVTVVEQSSSLRDEGCIIDFFGSGYDVAEQLGLLPELEKDSRTRLLARDLLMRAAGWPLVTPLIKRAIAPESIVEQPPWGTSSERRPSTARAGAGRASHTETV